MNIRQVYNFNGEYSPKEGLTDCYLQDPAPIHEFSSYRCHPWVSLASNIRGVCNLSGNQYAERVWKGGSSMTFSTRSLLHLLILRLLLACSVFSSPPPSSFVVRLELHTSMAISPAGFELVSLVALLVNKPGILLGLVEEVKILSFTIHMKYATA